MSSPFDSSPRVSRQAPRRSADDLFAPYHEAQPRRTSASCGRDRPRSFRRFWAARDFRAHAHRPTGSAEHLRCAKMGSNRLPGRRAFGRRRGRRRPTTPGRSFPTFPVASTNCTPCAPGGAALPTLPLPDIPTLTTSSRAGSTACGAELGGRFAAGRIARKVDRLARPSPRRRSRIARPSAAASTRPCSRSTAVRGRRNPPAATGDPGRIPTPHLGGNCPNRATGQPIRATCRTNGSRPAGRRRPAGSRNSASAAIGWSLRSKNNSFSSVVSFRLPAVPM